MKIALFLEKKKGWVKNWDDSSPSTWLTAWVLRLLSHASFQDWEDFLYIDPQVHSENF